MDENILSEILKRIEEIKEELNELESEVRQMGAAAEEPLKPDAPAEDFPEEPIDLSISVPDIPSSSFEDIQQSPVPEDLPEVSETAPAEEPESGQKAEEAAHSEPSAETEAYEAGNMDKKRRKKKTVLEAETAEKAVIDVMSEKEAWRTDRPGYPVKNIISAISLNDRLLLINSLFKEDPVLFQDTIAKFNGMNSLREAIDYIEENFKDWDLNSEPVYRLMMATRRKLR